jgi:hypothetical protein
MKPENKSGKRKAESGNILSRAPGRADIFFLFADFSFCRCVMSGDFSFRFPLSAFRFCL